VFSAFRNRDYLIYWLGSATSMTGGWVQTVSQGWLVYQLTNSRFLLGLVGFVGAAPLFGLTLFGGAIADRHDKKRVLLFTQSCFGLTAFLLGLLVQTRVVNIYHIIVLSFLNGLLMAVDAPTRQSIPVYLVGKENLTNAIALNSAAFNTARILGPALAGVLVIELSMAWCFYVNAISFLAVIAALLAVRAPTPPVSDNGASTVLADSLNGLRYIWGEPRIRTLILMASIPSVFVMPYGMLMLIIARDILHSGVDGYGHIMSATGIGALAGALTLAQVAGWDKDQATRQPRFRLLAAFGIKKGNPTILPGRGMSLLLAALADSLALVLAAHSKSLAFAEVFMLGVGFCTVFYNATTNTLIQSIVPDEFRGRVMSGFVFVMMGLSPFASLQAGAVAQWGGAPLAMTIGAGIFALMALYVMTTQKRIREL